jgi:hypothetical protein
MTAEQRLDDEMFINSNFPPKGPIWNTGVKPIMINPVSSASAVPQPVPQSTAQAKPQQAPHSEPKDTVQLSSKAQAHSSGDVDHDGDSH